MRSVAPIRERPLSFERTRRPVPRRSPEMLDYVMNATKNTLQTAGTAGMGALTSIANFFDFDYENENALRRDLAMGQENMSRTNTQTIAKLNMTAMNLYKKPYYALSAVQRRYLANREELLSAGKKLN